MPSKRIKAALEVIDRKRLYPIEEAVELLKGIDGPRFDESIDLALNLTFQLVHNLYFLPWTIQSALRRNGFEIVRFEVMPHAHTGVVPIPSTQMRAVCRKGEPVAEREAPPGRPFYQSLDASRSGVSCGGG